MNILVCDNVSPKGVAVLKDIPEFKVTVLDKKGTEDEFLEVAREMDAIVVRSQTKITRRVLDTCEHLKVVGRAGVGVDNVDVEAATEKGVVVMNTPSGNTISTAELTFSMMLALSRNIPQAHMSMKQGEWDRKAYAGVEVYDKSLGIIGLGRIGSEVAKRAQAFGMRVLAYDPYLSTERARALQVDLRELDELYAESDYITVHMPKTEETVGMINTQAFARMKAGVRILNCARGGIVVEHDLFQAIQEGKVAGAALDVYETEPPPTDLALRKLPQVIMTPHLGASTKEAQVNVGIEVAQAITDYLLKGEVRNAVNLPNLDAKTYALVKPYLRLGERLGRLVAQLSHGRNDRLVITYGGKVKEVPGDPISRCVLRGFLESVGGKDVNQVNVRSLADTLGLVVEEIKSSESTDFSEWMHVAAHAGDRTASSGGTVFGARHEPRIVRVNNQPVELIPDGVVLLLNNTDRPGMVGHLGSLMGKHNVNIASMSVSREQQGGKALTVLNLDSIPPQEAVKELQADPDLSNIRVVKL